MITILTPTYNRSHTLTRLFESLKQQDNKSFEWLVVDDGSTDRTLVLLESFKMEIDFPIRIIHQDNSGKHVALNTGVLAAKGDWVFIVDSDDALTFDAISEILDKLKKFDDEKIAGICFRKADFTHCMVGSKIEFASNVMCCSPTEAGEALKGDLAYIFRKEIMLNNLFPVINSEKFLPELFIWNKIGDAGLIYFFVNKYIYLCEYLTDGYSANFYSCLKSNPKGFLIFYKAQISREVNLIKKLKCFIRVCQCYLFVFLKKYK